MAWAKFWDVMFADFVWLGQNNSVFFFFHYLKKGVILVEFFFLDKMKTKWTPESNSMIIRGWKSLSNRKGIHHGFVSAW